MWTILSTNPNSSSPVTNASQIRDIWRWIRYQKAVAAGTGKASNAFRNTCVCVPVTPLTHFRMQISASSPSIVRSERNAIVWSFGAKVDQSWATPCWFTSTPSNVHLIQSGWRHLRLSLSSSGVWRAGGDIEQRS